MAIAFDAFSNSAQGTGNLSWTHTPVGTPRGVIVGIIQVTGGPAPSDQVSTVTYGGTSMTEVAGSPLAQSGGEPSMIHMFFLGASIPTGAQTVAVTVTGANQKIACAVTVTAGQDTSVVDTDATITSTSQANPSATLALGGITCFCGEVFQSGQNDPTGITPLTNWTARMENDFGTEQGACYTYDTISSTDVTMGWTQSADDACCIGIAVRENAAPGGVRRVFVVS